MGYSSRFLLTMKIKLTYWLSFTAILLAFMPGYSQEVDHFFIELENVQEDFRFGHIDKEGSDYKNHYYQDSVDIEVFIEKLTPVYEANMEKKPAITIYIHGMKAHHHRFQGLYNRTMSPKLYERPDYHSKVILSLVWHAAFDYEDNVAGAVASGKVFAPAIDKLVDSLQKINSDIEVDIINHSMGNRTFEGIFLGLDSIKSDLKFDNVIFAAADLPTNIFEEGEHLNEIHRRSRLSYISIHNKDMTLGASKYLNKADRLGLAGPIDVNGKSDYLRVIDCSLLRDNETMWYNFDNHKYFYSSPTARETLFQILVEDDLKLSYTPLSDNEYWWVIDEMKEVKEN